MTAILQSISTAIAQANLALVIAALALYMVSIVLAWIFGKKRDKELVEEEA